MGIRPRTGWLIGVGVAVVVALGSAVAYQLTSGDHAADGVPATTRVQRGTVTAAVSAAGTLQPAQTRGLAFSDDGTVTEVRVRPGDQVTAGQVLARIDDTAARDRVASAQDALDAAQESLDQAQAASSSPSPTAGNGCLAAAAYWLSPSPSSSTTPSPVPSPTAPPAPPRPTSQPTRPPTGHPSAAPSASGGNVGRRDCTEGGNANGGGNAGGGPDRILGAQQQVNNARLQLQNAQQDLAGTTITAPIAGKVLSVAGAVGSRATASGTGFIVLGDVAEMQVKADFPEADASGLKVGQTATVTLADRPGEPAPAKVTQVDPVGTVDGQMVRFGALLAFDQVPGDLLNGQSANVRVATESVTGVLYLPASAVHDSGDGTGTVMVRVGSTARQRTVQVGLHGDQNTEIRSGLSEGEEVRTSW